MSDETFTAPTSSQTGAAMTPATEGDYDAICAAVMETVRGRWFLTEYSRRNRHADTHLVLAALDRIEHGLRGKQTPESVERLRNDLMEMARAIAHAKAEIAGVSPDDGDAIGNVGLELDSVVRATDEATSNILAAAAQIQEVAWTMREQGNDAGLCDQLSAYAATIQTAASSQKLAGEHTQKVVDVMRDLEGRINDMIDVWGGYPAVDNRLLANSGRTTPALPPADFVTVEVNAPADVEPQQNSSNEHDPKSQELSQEPSRPREPRYLNDNGRARSANGHLVLDPSIAAAIRDAASLTKPVGAEGNAANMDEAVEVKNTGFASPGTPQDKVSDDSKDAEPEPTAPPTMQELPDPQAVGGSHALKNVTDLEAPETSEPRVSEAVWADATVETISPEHESSPGLVVLPEPVTHGEVAADNAGPDTEAPEPGTESVSPADATILSPPTPSLSGGSQTIVAFALYADDLGHPQAVAGTVAEPDHQFEPLAEMQPDAHERRGTQEPSAVELPSKPRPFVIDLDLEPLPIGLNTQPLPSTAAHTTLNEGAREIGGSARQKEVIPTTADPKPSGWLSEPVTALYDLPPLELPGAATPPSAITHPVTPSDSAPEGQAAKALPSGSRWPFAFLAPRSRTKPTAPTEPAPRETTAPRPAVTAPAVAFELSGLVVVAPTALSEPKRPTVAPSQPAAPEPSPPAITTAALLASESDAPVVVAAAAPMPSEPSVAAVAAAVPPKASNPDAPVVAAAVAPAAPPAAVATAAAHVVSKPNAPADTAAAVPAASEPSAPLVTAAVPPAASEPVAPVIASAVPAAASDPGGPVSAAAPTKPVTSNVKVRPSPPPPTDPLAALATLSDEEKLALFS